MSEKATCPGCNAHTSSVYDTMYGDYGREACQHCGLSRAAMIEITSIQDGRATTAVKARVKDLIIENARLRNEMTGLREILDGVEMHMSHYEAKP